MKNALGLRFETNSKEYEEKRAALTRLKNWIENMLSDVLEGVDLSRHLGTGISRRLPNDLSVTLEWYDKNKKPTFSVQHKGTTLRRESQFDLKIARTLYDHMDILFEIAQVACERKKVDDKFNAYMKRFELL